MTGSQNPNVNNSCYQCLHLHN